MSEHKHEESSVIEQIHRILQTKKCGDVVNSMTAHAISIPVTADVFEAADILAKNAITAAPVIQPKTNSSAEKLIGMFDYDDLTALVLSAFKRTSLNDTENPEDQHLHQHQQHHEISAVATGEHKDLAKFLMASHVNNLGNATVKSVADLSKNKPAVVVKDSDPLTSAVQVFKEGKRRCVVMNDKEEFIGMLSQSDVLKWIHQIVQRTKRAKHLDPMMEITGSAIRKVSGAMSPSLRNSGQQDNSCPSGAYTYADVFDKTLEELGLAKKPIAIINERNSVLDALQKMYNNNYSGLAIVGSGGEISGSISVKDVKFAFSMQWFQVLEHSCGSYIASARRQVTLKEKAGMDTAPVISVTPNSKLGYVLELLVATKTHRLWVVENRKPVGVVALADIIRTVFA
jgi:CBS domain-containing protein